MKSIVLKGRAIVEGKCRGEALVSKCPISFLGGVDPDSGRIIDKSNDQFGKCLKGKIFCFPHGRGSTVGSYVLYSLMKKGTAPKALVNQKADPVVVVGAIIANIPMLDQVDIEQIKTGAFVEVNANRGTVRIAGGRS